MVELQKDSATLKEHNTLVVGISYDSVEILKGFADASGVSFPLLSDEKCEAIKSFDVLNETRRGSMAHPGTFLVGQDGNVKAKLFVRGYIKRHTNDALIEAAASLNESDQR